MSSLLTGGLLKSRQNILNALGCAVCGHDLLHRRLQCASKWRRNSNERSIAFRVPRSQSLACFLLPEFLQAAMGVNLRQDGFCTGAVDPVPAGFVAGLVLQTLRLPQVLTPVKQKVQRTHRVSSRDRLLETIDWTLLAGNADRLPGRNASRPRDHSHLPGCCTLSQPLGTLFCVTPLRHSLRGRE